jgi:hypothetical protein
VRVGQWNKLIVLCLVCVGAIFLGYAGKISSEATVTLLASALGYVFGNGQAVVQQRIKETPIEGVK